VREHLRSGTEVLDGLRGIAILLVFTFHTWLFSWYTPTLSLLGHDVPVDVLPRTGYFGVDLFFVISGFVLFFPHAIRAISGAGATHGVREFALRRIVKIVPSYAIAFVVTLFSAASLHDRVALVPTIVRHALFINDFFPDDLGQANSVFWSLAIEAQFYVIFLCVAWLFRRQPLLTPALMVAIAVIYRTSVAAHGYVRWEPVYRELPAFLDVFAAGMFGAYAVVWIRAHVAPARWLAPVATLAACASLAAIWLLLSSANTIQYDPGGPENWDVIDRSYLAWSFALLAVSSSLALPFWRALLANPVLVFFSLISYNLYLWHTLVMIWLWRGNRLPHVLKDMHSDDHWKFLFIALSWPVAILISTALTYFVERPLIALVAAQTFSFDWSRALARLTPNSRAIASAEKPR
jgi:peptidoglycan/LPS O-acetylase OafA/YrhL